MTPKAVLFDMDGLLLDTEQVCLTQFIASRRAFGLSDSAETFYRCIGLRGAESNKIVTDSLDGKVDIDEFNGHWDRRISDAMKAGVPVKPGAVQLLSALSKKGLPMAVATSTRTETARRHLKSAGLLEFIKTLTGGDMVENPKPDPEAYHKAASSLGFEAAECVAFEDSEVGVRAAVASGARVVQVPDLIQPSEALRALGHVVAENLAEGAVEVGLLSEQDLKY